MRGAKPVFELSDWNCISQFLWKGITTLHTHTDSHKHTLPSDLWLTQTPSALDWLAVLISDLPCFVMQVGNKCRPAKSPTVIAPALACVHVICLLSGACVCVAKLYRGKQNVLVSREPQTHIKVMQIEPVCRVWYWFGPSLKERFARFRCACLPG